MVPGLRALLIQIGIKHPREAGKLKQSLRALLIQIGIKRFSASESLDFV